MTWERLVEWTYWVAIVVIIGGGGVTWQLWQAPIPSVLVSATVREPRVEAGADLVIDYAVERRGVGCTIIAFPTVVDSYGRIYPYDKTPREITTAGRAVFTIRRRISVEAAPRSRQL